MDRLVIGYVAREIRERKEQVADVRRSETEPAGAHRENGGGTGGGGMTNY
jgi:hypothetical protein